MNVNNYFCTVIRMEFPNIFSIRFYFLLHEIPQDLFIVVEIINKESNSENISQGVLILLRKQYIGIVISMGVNKSFSYVIWCCWFLYEKFSASKTFPDFFKDGPDIMNIGKCGGFSIDGDITGVGATYLLIL